VVMEFGGARSRSAVTRSVPSYAEVLAMSIKRFLRGRREPLTPTTSNQHAMAESLLQDPRVHEALQRDVLPNTLASVLANEIVMRPQIRVDDWPIQYTEKARTASNLFAVLSPPENLADNPTKLETRRALEMGDVAKAHGILTRTASAGLEHGSDQEEPDHEVEIGGGTAVATHKEMRPRRSAAEHARNVEAAALSLLLNFEFSRSAEYFVKAATYLPITDYVKISDLLNKAGAAYRQGALYQKAELSLREALSYRVRAYGQNSIEMAEVQKDLADICRVQGNFKTAEELLQRSLENYECTYEPTDLRLIHPMSYMIRVLDDQAKYDEASAFGRRLLNIVTINSVVSTEVIDAVHNIASVYEEAGVYDKAEELFDIASRKIASLGGKDKDILQGDHLNHVGKLKHVTGYYAESEKYYRNALTLRESTYPRSHPKIAQTMTNLGALYRDQDRRTEAHEWLSRAREGLIAVLGMYHIETALNEYHLGRLLLDEQRYHESQTILNAARITFDKLGSNYRLLGLVTNALGELQRQIGNYEQAYELYLQSLMIISKTHGPNHREIADVQNNIGLVELQMENLNEARTHLFHALQIYRAGYSDIHPGLWNIYVNLGALYQKWDDWEHAQEYYVRAVYVAERCYHINHEKVATTLYALGNLQVTSGDYDAALESYRRMLEIWDRQIEIPSLFVSRSMEDYANFMKRIGQIANAQRLLSRARAIRKETVRRKQRRQ
jgi:tetratricopeptide (TPR) repeat protein